MSHIPRRLVALALGAGFALGQPPFDLWWIALPALVVVLALVHREPMARAAGWIGWFFGLGYFAISLHWIWEPFQVDAAATGWMAPFAVVGMAAGLALFWGVAFWGGIAWGRGVASVAVVWGVAELARAYVLTGFPWGLVGYVWAPTPVAQWHAVIGPHGVTLMTVLLAAGLADGLIRRRAMQATLMVAGGVALWIAGDLMTLPVQDVEDRPVVRLIQPNAPQHQKWDRDFIPIFFDRQIAFTAQDPRPDLVVWPETSVPNLLRNAGPAFEIISDAAGDAPVVLGIQRRDGFRYFNSLITLDAIGGIDQLYDKHHLVPFGEYMPAASLFARFNILGLAARAEAGYSAGPGVAPIDLGDLGKALPLICYEAVFPQIAGALANRPDMLIQITNDAWFGSFAGPQQHLQQARLRAIEQGLPMIRVANTGISAMIDPAGRIIASLPLNEAGYLDAALPVAGAPTLYSKSGDWPIFLAMIVALGMLRRGKRTGRH